MGAMTAIADKDKKTIPLGATVGIPPRRMDFEFPTESTRYYYDNDAFKSSFWGALSALFPEGESFFVEAVRAYRDQITDPKLKAEVAGFIGQEAMHSKEHQAFNDMLVRHGYPVDKMDRQLALLLNTVQKYAPKSLSLAATVCLEHYTAIIAEQLLRDPNHVNMADKELIKLWLWHALEENEHKTVAYDVYQQVNGNYALRAGTMIPTTIIFFAVTFWFHGRMLASDKQLFNVRQNYRGLKYFWGKGGLFRRLAPQFFDFFKRDFHPNDHDTTALLAEWKEKLFGQDGMLSDQIKNPHVHAAAATRQ